MYDSKEDLDDQEESDLNQIMVQYGKTSDNNMSLGQLKVSNQGNDDPPTMSLDEMKVRPPKKLQADTSHGIHLSKAIMLFHLAASCGPITGPSAQQYKPKPHLKVNTSHTGDADEVVHHATVPTAHQLIQDRKPPKWADHDLPTPPAKKQYL
ncbi:hypothetical protein V8B97DRAFT_1914831 [Scleroderma yunnanense]